MPAQGGGAFNVMGDLGYPNNVGVGVSVAQLTSRTTSVTCNAITGQITTRADSLAAGAEAEFTVNNAFVTVNDVILVCLQVESSTGTSLPFVSTVANGSFKITLTNLHASTADTSASVINFIIFRGANS